MHLFTHIKELVQVRESTTPPLKGEQMKELPSIKDAFLVIDNDQIIDYGPMSSYIPIEGVKAVDKPNSIITPGYVDSHTHLVFAATREAEFKDRINGFTYEEIAARGGGILNSARKLAAMSEDELYEQALVRLKELVKMGTTAIEVKSGYGLSLEAELTILRVVKRLKEQHIIPIKATFLGAHAIPGTYKNNRGAYIDLIINDMLPIIEQEQLADYIDVFCEKNYFTVDEMLQVLQAGQQHGLKAKVHVNQFNAIGAIPAAVNAGAISVDHLEVMDDVDYTALQKGATIATALPSCSFFLGLDYAPVKQMIDHDIAVALATDFNPGSTPSGNMNFVFALACVKMKMTIEQAFNALTINAAHALELEHEIGSITRGKKANLLFFDHIDSLAAIPYHFGHLLVNDVMVDGQFMN
jgi:imidazolonepropionase